MRSQISTKSVILAIMGILFTLLATSSCSSNRQMMTSEQARQEYDPYQDGYNYLDDYDDYYYDYMGY